MLPTKRRVEGLAFLENKVTEVRLPKGALEEGLVLSGTFDDTITVAATSVRRYGVPIKSISVIGDNGKTLQVATPADLAVEAILYEQAQLADIIAPPAGVGVAVQTGKFAIPLMFAEPMSGKDRLTTAFASWAYDEPILRVEWGSHAEVYVGGTGSITAATIEVTAEGLSADFSSMGDPFAWARRLWRNLRSYKTTAIAGATTDPQNIELPRTADIRSLVLFTLDANGEPVDTMLKSIGINLNDNTDLFSRVAARAIRVSNGKLFGQAIPTGVYVLEFAEDQDIFNVLEARSLTSLNLRYETNAVPGTIRTFIKRLERAA